MLAVALHAVSRFDGRDDVVQQVALEDEEGGDVFEDVTHWTVIFLGTTVRHDDDHRMRFAVGDKVIEQDLGLGIARPFGLVAADTVQKVEHGIVRFRRVTRRRIDIHLPLRADGLRVVFDHLQLAARDSFAPCAPLGGRLGKGGFVVLVERDGAPGFAWLGRNVCGRRRGGFLRNGNQRRCKKGA